MTLAADAENARDVGAAFDRFVDALPDHFAEITALVAELYAISSALRDLDINIASREYGPRTTHILDDLDRVRLSLSMTLKDALELFGRLGDRGYPPTPGAYRQVWEDICIHFRREGRNTLLSRLERYRKFLLELSCIMRRCPPDAREMDILRSSITGLLAIQDRRLDLAFDAPALGPQAVIRENKTKTKTKIKTTRTSRTLVSPTTLLSSSRVCPAGP
ncbi:MAG: hypothetical protein M1830_008568 [Pleopsidium flavum]|nr:MAG: hypothetical protein M1830_008568 [Pleopsidium flavum]